MKLAIVSALIGLASLVVALPAPQLPTPVPGSTITQCYEVISTLDGGIIETPIASGTAIADPNNPPTGIQCWALFQSGGGIEAVPIPVETGAPIIQPAPIGDTIETSSTNVVTRIAVPIIASLGSFLVLIGGIVLYLRYRSRQRSQKSQSTRKWVNRPGGWADNISKPQPMELQTGINLEK